MNLEYSEAVGEVLQILKYTDKELIYKIPKGLLEFWERNAVINSELKFDTNESMENLNLKPKTKALVGMIYRNYWCDAEERKEYDKILMQNEERLQEEARKKYNPDEIFKNKEEKIIEQITTIEQQENVNMVPYKETIFIKIIKMIKDLFKR